MGNSDFRQLIPLLHPRTRIHDVDVLKAWYEAVADAFRSELATDLFALWLFSADGDPILIEPEALAEDNLGVPRAEPLANQLILDDVEDRIRRAGYGSVLLRPVRHGGQDVALLLLASFPPHIYGIRAESLVETAVSVMAPMLARVTRAEEQVPERIMPGEPEGMVPAVPDRVRDRAREGELFEGLADAIGGASTPRDLMLALSFALQPILPHDSYELLIPDSTGENLYRLGLHGHGTLWGDPALVLPRAALDPTRLFGDRSGFILDDASVGEPTVPELVTVRGPEEPPRAMVGTTLRVVERQVGYLLLGSAGPGFYREEDLALLDRMGALLAPRVDSLVLAWQYSVLRSQFDVLRHVPMHLARVAELLAVSPLLGEGGKLFVQQAAALLPVAALEFAVRLNDEARVAVVRPGTATPLPDLPQEPIDGTGVAAVVRGEAPYLLTTQDDPAGGQLTVLVVPLRSGGRIFGAMAMTAKGAAPFARMDMALAQQLADLAAPHLDLARRAGGNPAPFIPGWKRPSWRPEKERNG
jgi:hypothetical protein